MNQSPPRKANKQKFRKSFSLSKLMKKHGKKCRCVECKAKRYVEKIKEGKITPLELPIIEDNPKDLSPLQIRYRAYVERRKREDDKIGKDAYPWQRRSRTPKMYSLAFFRRH